MEESDDEIYRKALAEERNRLNDKRVRKETEKKEREDQLRILQIKKKAIKEARRRDRGLTAKHAQTAIGRFIQKCQIVF